jgi:hypothetical protein
LTHFYIVDGGGVTRSPTSSSLARSSLQHGLWVIKPTNSQIHRWITTRYEDLLPSAHSAALRITHVDIPCTDNWLCHLWSVHRTGDPRGVGSLRSGSVPFPRPPTAPELYPCAPGPNYPCNGRVSGSFLSVQLPARVLTRVLKTGSLRYLRPMAQFDGQHPSSQGGCEARLVGLSHCKSNHTNDIYRW